MFVRRCLTVPEVLAYSYTASNQFTVNIERHENKEQQRHVICMNKVN